MQEGGKNMGNPDMLPHIDLSDAGQVVDMARPMSTLLI